MDENAQAAGRFNQLDPTVQDLLSRLEPDEVESLKYVATIPREELRGMMKMFRDVKAVSRFMRWLIISIVAIFIGAVTVGENVMKVIAWLKGGPH